MPRSNILSVQSMKRKKLQKNPKNTDYLIEHALIFIFEIQSVFCPVSAFIVNICPGDKLSNIFWNFVGDGIHQCFLHLSSCLWESRATVWICYSLSKLIFLLFSKGLFHFDICMEAFCSISYYLFSSLCFEYF